MSRALLLLFVLAFLVLLGGALSPGHREGVGALLMVGAYPVWVGYRLLKKERS